MLCRSSCEVLFPRSSVMTGRHDSLVTLNVLMSDKKTVPSHAQPHTHTAMPSHAQPHPATPSHTQPHPATPRRWGRVRSGGSGEVGRGRARLGEVGCNVCWCGFKKHENSICCLVGLQTCEVLLVFNSFVLCCWCGTQKHETSYLLVGLQIYPVVIFCSNSFVMCVGVEPNHMKLRRSFSF
jgi:hypothetical protein